MGSRGIGDETHVVIYDHMGGPVRHPALVGPGLLRPRRRQRPRRRLEPLGRGGAAGRLEPDRLDAEGVHAQGFVPTFGPRPSSSPPDSASPAPTDRRPRRRPVHRRQASRGPGRPHPGRPQRPPRTLLRRRRRLPPDRRDPGRDPGSRPRNREADRRHTATAGSRRPSSSSTSPRLGFPRPH